ncbi:MAG: hypothetical protein HYS04_20345 [Acidobacteria bacterium]|nr:hypothetical protein [Acidobacteriota bacterium]
MEDELYRTEKEKERAQVDPSAKPETFKEHNQATGTSTEIPLIHRRPIGFYSP